MYGTPLAARSFCLLFSPYRAYIPPVTLAARARMVSMKTIQVCDESSLKDGQMFVLDL